MNFGNGLLKKYLTHQGVENVGELTEAEKATYSQWSTIFSKTTTMEDIDKFLRREIILLDRQLREAVKRRLELEQRILVARIENYEAIRNLINRPEYEKKKVTEQIKRLIGKKPMLSK